MKSKPSTKKEPALTMVLLSRASNHCNVSHTPKKDEDENTSNLKKELAKLFGVSLCQTLLPLHTQLNIEPQIKLTKPMFGDYKCEIANVIFAELKGKCSHYQNPLAVGEAIKRNLPFSEILESSSVAANGFVNVVLSKKWIAENIQRMLVNGIETWAPTLSIKRVLVDFSSPNIAKELHVGHLRSTIIGDTIARMLEFSNVEVLRINHVGDWGTQFGMLIEYLFEMYPNFEDVKETAIGDLQAFYKVSQQRFLKDPEFTKRAQKAVVRLQGGEPKYRQAWTQICNISRKEFDKVYQRLGVQLEEKGESFYNPYIPRVIEELTQKGLVKESEGARVISIEGLENHIVVKSDGGYNYASTELAALWYRLNEEKVDWIIYVTDSSQESHFMLIFKAAKHAGWLPSADNLFPKVTHVGFGVYKGDNGKPMKTRSTDVILLADVLDEAKKRCKSALIERGKAVEWTDDQLNKTAEAVGYAAVKYADLKDNRKTDHIYNFDKMLNDKGDTAVYLLYAHARICSIITKSGRDIDELKKKDTLVLDHADERALGLHILRFSETVEEACMDLFPNVLCHYVYNLANYFSRFYSNCQVVGSAQEASRLLLCEATAVVMRKCFFFLGIVPVNQL
ncbi:unnamed protein product [Cuscuta epithymum]|uniref:arginine--tRNA ligase n=2 Tax=Cuscuta epithymum TaxID=186058 RepID=A0AAV0F5G3_9ASTE|nr:unnamed protein product [Cuscuta epithymum]